MTFLSIFLVFILYALFTFKIPKIYSDFHFEFQTCQNSCLLKTQYFHWEPLWYWFNIFLFCILSYIDQTIMHFLYKDNEHNQKQKKFFHLAVSNCQPADHNATPDILCCTQIILKKIFFPATKIKLYTCEMTFISFTSIILDLTI